MNPTRTRILAIVLWLLPEELSAGVKTTSTWCNIKPYTFSPPNNSFLYFQMKGIQPWYLRVGGGEVYSASSYGHGIRDLTKNCLWRVEP